MLELINILFILVCNLHLFRRWLRITFDSRPHLWYAMAERNCPSTRSFCEISPQRALFPLHSDSPSKGKPGAGNPTITANPFHREHVRFRHRRQQLTPRPIPATRPFPSFRHESENHDKYRVPRKSHALSSLLWSSLW